MHETHVKIVAPVCSAAEAELALHAGADEIYCGAMLDDWIDAFGESDLLSRRQGRLAHLRTVDEMAAVTAVATQYGKSASLAVNAKYTRSQINAVLRLINVWEKVGGNAVLVSDVGILQSLGERDSKLHRHLSTLTGTFNSSSVAFFAKLGVTRIVLPRDLTLSEIKLLIANAPKMEYEALAMYQKCQFIDGMCGFYHGLRIPVDDMPAVFDYFEGDDEEGPAFWSHDPDYEGHGCQLRWSTDSGEVRHLARDDFSTPHCAACTLDDLSDAGVSYFKIAGRAYSPELITRAIRFLRAAVGSDNRELYATTFKGACTGSRCYYRK